MDQYMIGKGRGEGRGGGSKCRETTHCCGISSLPQHSVKQSKLHRCIYDRIINVRLFSSLTKSVGFFFWLLYPPPFPPCCLCALMQNFPLFQWLPVYLSLSCSALVFHLSLLISGR